MRLTPTLWKQHTARWFIKHWTFQGKRTPWETGAEAHLKAKGFPVRNALEVIADPPRSTESHKKIEIIGQLPKPIPWDETHPLYHERPCYSYKDTSVLVEGFKQAQVLFNTVLVENQLPPVIEELAQSLADQQTQETEELVQRSVFNCQLLDAYQEKLPKIIDPVRPAHNFARVFGVVDRRRNQLMTERMLELCASLHPGSPGLIIHKPKVRVALERGEGLINLEVQPGALIANKSPLKPHADPASIPASLAIPDIYPMKATISLHTTHFYDKSLCYPFPKNCGHPHLTTAILHFNETEIKNFHEEPVTEEQMLGRSLGHAFTLALASARQKYGDKLRGALPEPVTVQIIQTDARGFHFLVYQLNTLNLEDTEGVRNMCWSSPIHNLFTSCKYVEGTPVLAGYDPKVFPYFLALYKTSVAKSHKLK